MYPALMRLRHHLFDPFLGSLSKELTEWNQTPKHPTNMKISSSGFWDTFNHLTARARASWGTQHQLPKTRRLIATCNASEKELLQRLRPGKLVKHLWAMRLGIWYNRRIEDAMNRVLPRGFWGSRNSNADLIYGPSDINHDNLSQG